MDYIPFNIKLYENAIRVKLQLFPNISLSIQSHQISDILSDSHRFHERAVVI